MLRQILRSEIQDLRSEICVPLRFTSPRRSSAGILCSFSPRPLFKGERAKVRGSAASQITVSLIAPPPEILPSANSAFLLPAHAHSHRHIQC